MEAGVDPGFLIGAPEVVAVPLAGFGAVLVEGTDGLAGIVDAVVEDDDGPATIGVAAAFDDAAVDGIVFVEGTTGVTQRHSHNVTFSTVTGPNTRAHVPSALSLYGGSTSGVVPAAAAVAACER